MFRFIYSLLETSEYWLISSPKLLDFVLKNSPPRLLKKMGDLKMFLFIKSVPQRVPAYKDFLKKQNFLLSSIRSEKDIEKIPLTTKDNYVSQYSIEERCQNGEMPASGNIDESAGSTGKATMWVRSLKEEKKLNKLINYALNYSFGTLKKKNIIVLNCWSNGPWATGIKFAFIAQHSAVVKAIGTDKKNVIDTIKTFGKNYEYLICGYPPFTKEVIDYGIENGLDWSKYRVDVVTGGEGFSEGWRDFMREMIHGSGGEVFSAYGASDIDIGIGFETELSIRVRKLLNEDPAFRKELLGDDRIPLFFGQYNPLAYYIEEVGDDSELVFTLTNIDTVSPKIRYNLKDSGKVRTFNQIAKSTPKKILSKKIMKNSLKLPFIVVYGRSDGTVSLDGANIYPADVQHSLYKSTLGKYIDSFHMRVSYSDDNSMYFDIAVELKEGTKKGDISKDLLTEAAAVVHDYLIIANKDFKESCENNPESLYPRITPIEKGEDIFAQNRAKIKNVYYSRDKR